MNRFVAECNNFIKVLGGELKFILHDGGVMLIMLGAILIYTTLYSLVYKNQVVREIPVAVVDLDGTSMSREFSRIFDASPNVEVAYNPTSLDDAETLFWNRKVYGVMVLPRDMEKTILAGNDQAMASIYLDASYFLMYKQVFAAATAAVTYDNLRIESAKFMAKGMAPQTALATAEPVYTDAVKLYNRYEGYATFVMPAIMLLILQQTILIGVGIIGGTFAERKLYKRYFEPSGRRYSSFSITMGKTFAYMLISAMVSLFVYGIYYKIFDYPVRGFEPDVIQFFVPYILSCSFLALGISTLFKYRETSILVLVVWSIPFLLFSGVSFPKEGMPDWLFMLGKIFPSSSAIDGFIRLQVMGATLKDVSTQYFTLWSLTGVYGVFAFLMIRRKCAKDSVQR